MAVKKATATKTAPKSKKQVPAPKGRPAKTSNAADDVAGEKEVTIDRRRGSRREDEETTESSAKLERRSKVQRRRQIDPTTCERDYTDEEVGFMNAMDEYKRASGRMFPTCSEVLEVIRGLGYVKLTPAELAIIRPVTESTVEISDFNSDDEDDELEFDSI